MPPLSVGEEAQLSEFSRAGASPGVWLFPKPPREQMCGALPPLPMVAALPGGSVWPHPPQTEGNQVLVYPRRKRERGWIRSDVPGEGRSELSISCPYFFFFSFYSAPPLTSNLLQNATWGACISNSPAFKSLERAASTHHPPLDAHRAPREGSEVVALPGSGAGCDVQGMQPPPGVTLAPGTDVLRLGASCSAQTRAQALQLWPWDVLPGAVLI